MSATCTPLGLSDDERAAFRANGYLCVPEFADPDDVAALRDTFVRLFASPIGRSSGDRGDMIGDVARDGTIPQIVHLERYDATLRDSPVRERGFAIARDLLGEDALLDCETGIVKMAHSPDATPWHQDEAFWHPGATHEAISIWIPLQDVTVDGGCMEFVPGSHRGDVRPHEGIPGVEAPNGFQIAAADTRFRTLCPLPAGAATVHHARVAHATGPNRTPVARYAYVMVFGGPWRGLAEPRDFAWQGGRARDLRRVAFRRGLAGLVNRVLRRAAITIARLSALNDRRRYEG